MASDQEMLVGLACYEDRDYLKALQHFSQVVSGPPESLQEVVNLAMRGVVNLQLF